MGKESAEASARAAMVFDLGVHGEEKGIREGESRGSRRILE